MNFKSAKLFDRCFVAISLKNACLCPKCRTEYSLLCDKTGKDHHVKSNRPILLSCGHNMCENCVYHNRNNLTCAMCLSPIIIPKDPSKQFANFYVRDYFDMNFFLMGQLNHWRFYCKEGLTNNTLFMSATNRSNFNSTLPDGDTSAAATFVIKCVECEKLPSLGKCRVCKAYYCKRCFDNIHKNSKVLKMHTLQYFDRDQGHQSELIRLTKSRFCKRHRRQCDRYCKKCDLVCCSDCARHDHQFHHYKELVDENGILMDDLRLTLDNAQLARENLNKGQKDIKTMETQFEEYATKTLEEISNYFLQLHSFLQNEEKQIMDKFQEMSQQPQFMLREANVKLNESQETLNSIRNTLEQYENAPPANFYLGHVLPKYNHVIQQIPSNIHTVKPQSNPFNFEVKHDIRPDIQNSISYNYKDPKLFIKLDTSFFDSSPSIMDVTTNSITSILNTARNESLSPKPKGKKKNVKNKKFTNVNQIQDVASSNISATNSSSNAVNLVHITHIKSPEHFYVQRVNEVQNIRQLSHTYLCNDMANNIPKTISEGYYYMAYHVTDKQWYRGVVKKILPNDIYEIFLVDFGLVMEAAKENLCDMEERHMKVPFSAIRCAIYDIMPAGKKWTALENNLLLELVQNKPVRASIIEKVSNDMYKIDLQTEVSKSVHDTFLYTGLARERPGINSFKLQAKVNVLTMNIEKRIPKININGNEIVAVTVLHIEGPGEFYVIKNESIDSKEELKIELNQYYNDNSTKVQQIYLGTVHMCCAVKVNGVWYRGIIEEIKDKGHLNVRLVDEGRRELINWRQAFVLVEKYRNNREFAISCMLADIEPLQENNYLYTSAAIEDFKQMTANPQLRMEIVAATPKICKVVLYICKKTMDINIGAVLVKQKYGISTGEMTLVTEIAKTPKHSKHEPPITIISKDSNFKTNASNVKPVTRSMIKITHLVSPGEFYIQLSNLDQGTKAFHQQIQETQTKKFGNKQPLPYENREWYEENHCLIYTKYHSSQFVQPVDGPLLEQFEWYRGIINKITYLPGEEPTFSVFLRDIGVTVCSIYSQQLYTIDPQLDRVTNAVYCCHLACIEPAGGKNWSQSAIDSFTHYVTTAEALSASSHGKKKPEQNSLAIVLWSSKMETANPLAPCITKYANINRNLVRKGLAHMVESLDTKQQFDQIEETELANGEITLEQWFKSFSDNALLKAIENNAKLPLHLSGNDDDVENSEMCVDDNPLNKHLTEMDFIDTKGKKAPAAWLSPKLITKTMFAGYPTYIDFDCVVYLHEADDKKFLEKMTKKLTETYGSVEAPSVDAQFSIDQACVVKYHLDSKYYRGIITEDINSEKEWGVKFIDYGNVESVEGKDLRPYAPFPNLPAMASTYVIDGIKPKGGAEKYAVEDLDQMHALLVAKFVSIRIQSSELQKDIKRCSMRAGAKDLACEFIERGLAEADYKPYNDKSLSEKTPLNMSQSESKASKSRNPLPPADIDDYAIFSQGNNMSVDFDYMQMAIEQKDEKDYNLSDNGIEADDDDDDESVEYDHLNELVDRLSKNAEIDKITGPNFKTAVETPNSVNATIKPPPKKRMFNDNDYTKMMNIMKVYGAEDVFDNYDQDFNEDSNENNEEEDDDVIELGQSFAMNYWHNAAEDMREEEDEEINEQLERRVYSFDEDFNSDFDSFHPYETSTAFSHISGIEHFKAPQLPSAMHHFKCRVVSIITPLILQIFPVHTEFHYRDVELQRTIKEMVKQSLPPLTNFEPRTLCLACYTKDKHWYRAVIKSFNPNAKTVEVLYVDYLNSETLPIKYVRQCPKELLGWPLRTFRVCLHGLNVNPKIKELEVRMELQKLLNKRELFAVVKKHPITNSMVLDRSLSQIDHIEIALYESKESSLKGITIYNPLIEKNYFQRF